MEVVKFYEPDMNNGFLSNFYIVPFTVHDKYWLSSEHYYQSHKFIFDGCTQFQLEISENIRKAATPAIAFALSRIYINYMDPNWDKPVGLNDISRKIQIMKDAITYKFTSHPILAAKLKDTYPFKIEEASADSFWGTGNSNLDDYTYRESEDLLMTTNVLGKLLYTLRSQLLVQD